MKKSLYLAFTEYPEDAKNKEDLFKAFAKYKFAKFNSNEKGFDYKITAWEKKISEFFESEVDFFYEFHEFAVLEYVRFYSDNLFFPKLKSASEKNIINHFEKYSVADMISLSNLTYLNGEEFELDIEPQVIKNILEFIEKDEILYSNDAKNLINECEKEYVEFGKKNKKKMFSNILENIKMADICTDLVKAQIGKSSYEALKNDMSEFPDTAFSFKGINQRYGEFTTFYIHIINVRVYGNKEDEAYVSCYKFYRDMFKLANLKRYSIEKVFCLEMVLDRKNFLREFGDPVTGKKRRITFEDFNEQEKELIKRHFISFDRAITRRDIFLENKYLELFREFCKKINIEGYCYEKIPDLVEFNSFLMNKYPNESIGNRKAEKIMSAHFGSYEEFIKQTGINFINSKKTGFSLSLTGINRSVFNGQITKEEGETILKIKKKKNYISGVDLIENGINVEKGKIEFIRKEYGFRRVSKIEDKIDRLIDIVNEKKSVTPYLREHLKAARCNLSKLSKAVKLIKTVNPPN